MDRRIKTSKQDFHMNKLFINFYTEIVDFWWVNEYFSLISLIISKIVLKVFEISLTCNGTQPKTSPQIWHPRLGATGGKHLENSNVDPICAILWMINEHPYFRFSPRLTFYSRQDDVADDLFHALNRNAGNRECKALR